MTHQNFDEGGRGAPPRAPYSSQSSFALSRLIAACQEHARYRDQQTLGALDSVPPLAGEEISAGVAAVELWARRLSMHRRADRDELPRPFLPRMEWSYVEFASGPIHGWYENFDSTIPPPTVDIVLEREDVEAPTITFTYTRREMSVDGGPEYQMVWPPPEAPGC